MSFSENIKNLRKVHGLDQATLAQTLNVSPKTISHWETNYTEPSISQLIALANYFDISIDELVGRKFF